MPQALPAAMTVDHGEVLTHARERRGAGARVIGVVGAGVPDVLLRAGGADVVHVQSAYPTPMADRFVPGEASRLRALAEPALDGRLAFLDLLIVTRAHEWLYYSLKEAVRTGVGQVPPLHLLDLVFTHSEAARRHNVRQLAALADAMARVTGEAIDRDALSAAVPAANRCNDRLATIQHLRDQNRLAGSRALAAVAASRRMPPDAFVAAVDPWLGAIAEAPVIAGRRLLLLPSEASDVAAIHAAVEALGATIVAEDSDLGSRAASPAIGNGEPLAAIGEALLAAASGPDVQPRERRLDWAETQLRCSDLDGVIVAIPPDDRRFGWDYPALRDMIAAVGLPSLLLRADPARDPDAATAALGDFLATLDRSGREA